MINNYNEYTVEQRLFRCVARSGCIPLSCQQLAPHLNYYFYWRQPMASPSGWREKENSESSTPFRDN